MSPRKTNAQESAKLRAAATLLTAMSPDLVPYYVGNTWFDYGQRWEWTTIYRESRCGSVQVLCPRDWEAIITAETPEQIAAAVTEIRNDKFFNERR